MALFSACLMGLCALAAGLALNSWQGSSDVTGLLYAGACLLSGLSAQRILEPGEGEG